LTCNDYFKNISKNLFLHRMIAYNEMYLEMKFQIFSSVKSIVIIKKIKVSLLSQHLTDMINMYQEYQMQQK